MNQESRLQILTRNEGEKDLDNEVLIVDDVVINIIAFKSLLMQLNV